MNPFAALWAIPAVRKATEYGIIALMFFVFVLAVRHQWIDLGIQRGTAQQQDVSSVNLAQTQKTDHDTTVPQVQILNQQILNLGQEVSSLKGMVAGIAAVRQQKDQQVQGMTPDQVLSAFNLLLGRSRDSAEPLTEDQRRNVVSCMTQLPECNRQVAGLQDVVAKQDAQIEKEDSRALLLMGYATRWQSAYVQLSNNYAKPKRKWWCAGICKRADKLPTPDPQELTKTMPDFLKEEKAK